MKINVLLSSYNGEKYIRQQINSILEQDFQGELLLTVRDDGSKDSTIEILKEFESKSLLKWYNGDNLRCAKSFWNLLHNCDNADYYAFCDQDDFWESNKLSSAIKLLNENENKLPILYIGSVKIVDKDLNLISMPKAVDFKMNFAESLIRSIGPGCTFVFNHEARKSLMKYNGDGIDIHDWMAHKIIAGVGSIIFDNTPHMLYRQHGNNVIGAEKKGISAYFKKLKRFLNGESTNVRLNSAKIIKETYYDDLSKENKEIIDTLVNYKKCFKNKVSLAKNKNLKLQNKKDNFKLICLIMLGKL